MLQSTTLKFLKDLKKNNNKPWFDEHRTQYETARADFFSMIEKLIPAIAKFDEPIGHLTVKETVFRINRDVRFSKDKALRPVVSGCLSRQYWLVYGRK